MAIDVTALRQARPATAFHYFPTIGSTMTEAARLASANAPNGSVVIADEQTAGVGRLGRTWVSAPDVGVYCSVILRLPLPNAKLPIANLLLGLAVAEAIEKTSGLACDLRWPNDVLISAKKVCGILTQLVDRVVVAGIGLNVNNAEFAPGLRTPATSLLLESGHLQPREPLLIAILESIDNFTEMLRAHGADSILRAFTSASSYVNGRGVTVEDTGLEGTTAGLDDCGFLMLRTADNRLHRIASGGVRATA